jgi:uncharacterized protein (TIGR03083 family)
MDDAATWKLIHHQRAALADTMETLSAEQWALPSLCTGWSEHVAAAHVLAGAEQTVPHFLGCMAASAFRFNVMIDRAARRTAKVSNDEIISRLRARTTTTNRPPAPVMTMLGEIVVHSADICQPLGIADGVDPEATAACLQMYTRVSFPVGTKKRIEGLRLVADDVGWSYGSGPEVSGPGRSLLLAMTGRSASLGELAGDGLGTLKSRLNGA